MKRILFALLACALRCWPAATRSRASARTSRRPARRSKTAAKKK